LYKICINKTNKYTYDSASIYNLAIAILIKYCKKNDKKWWIR